MSRPGGYSCNDNQNYFVDGGRTTSKVLRPPGGGSSISLAYDAPDPSNSQNNYRSSNLAAQRRRRDQEVTGKIGSAPTPVQQAQEYQQPRQHVAQPLSMFSPEKVSAPAPSHTGDGGAPLTHNPADHNHKHLGLGVSGNAFANGSNQNCGNVITDRSSTRIHAPPGGHSSITFG
mmetsp:Transcript_14016/g.27949  ORF Transcript_14016/g.27949 Transcript_14016/m.27949 type:complete len:174 (-) Transcript_14016:205-726(-)